VPGAKPLDGSGARDLPWAGSWVLDTKASREATRIAIGIALARAGIRPEAFIARDFII